MEAFLQYCKSKLPSLHEFKRVRIVLGNEACDLDSAVSTLVTAFMLYSLKVNESELILPVLNLSRKELRLHTEVTFFLEECAISLDLVPCRDEIDLNALHSQGKLVLTLVDQNVLPAQDAHLQACVTCVIDHHKPELKASDNCDITIEPVGSCCTLVGELLLKKSPHLLKEPQIALLLYGTILLDTVCLSESAKKTTPSDVRIIKKLEELLPDVTREEVFSALQKAKTDISGLSFEDLLIKDLKVISEGSIKIAISSLPCLTEDALKYPKSEASLKNFAFANRYEVVLLLGISVSKKTNAVQRQLAVFSSNPELRRKIVEVLSSSKADLQLSKLDVPHVQSVEVFQQGNVTASRKVILPLLRQFLQQSTTPGEVMSIKVEAIDPSLSSNGHRASSMATHIEVVDTMNNATTNDEKPALPAISAMNGSSDSMMFFGVGPGEPLSSQGSSAQNSCPYTPQNSVMEEANEVDAAHQEQLLPSFNSRDMIEKIEEKRGRLRGYEKGSSLNSSIPFTPKNSFVESSFDQYEAPQTLDMNSLSSDEFIEKVNRKKASLSGINEQLPIGAEGFAAGAEDNARNSSGKEDTVKSRSMNGNIVALENVEGLSTLSPKQTSSKLSPVNSELAKDSGSEKEKKVENHVSHPLEENWSDDKLLDPVDVDLDMASSYQAETVDFPESPQHLKLMRQKTREAQGLKSEDDDDVKKNSQSEDLSLIEDGQSNKKDVRRYISFTPFSSLQFTTEDDDEYFEDNPVTGQLVEDGLANTSCDSYGMNSENSLGAKSHCSFSGMNSFTSLEISQLDSFISEPPSLQFESMSLFPDDSKISWDGNKVKNSSALVDGFLFNERASDFAPDAVLLQKIKSCFDQEKIKDLYVLSGRLQDILSAEEIEEVLNRSDMYSEYIDDEVFEVLSYVMSERQATSINGELGTSGNEAKDTANKKKTICADRSQHSDVMDDIKIRAVFENIKKSGESNIRQKEKQSNTSLEPQNMRAFFEQSLAKSASTLKMINPGDNHLMELPKVSPSFTKPDSIILSASQLKDHQKPTSVLLVVTPEGAMENKVLAVHKLPEESSQHCSKERPGAFNTEKRKKVISVNPDILSSDAREDDQKSLSSLSNKSDGDVASQVEDIVTPDDIITPEDLDDSLFERMGSSELIPEFSAAEEYEEERSWKTCVVGGEERKIDMKVIEPYKKVLSHGGYFGPNRHAIIVFSACYLPDRSRRDYDYVMDNLFLYVLTTLDQLVAEDYVLVYLHGATQRSNMPSFGWLKRCYQMIDRRLRKNLKGLYLVHPTFWLKTIVIMTKPFISSKFSRKLRFVSSLQELSDLIPMDHVCIPDKVKQFDEERLLNEA